ncbi:MAG: hypothetical protein M1830_004081 [Pleopsidium flavum]|nr:MAG: hypothetical protein M1830_004081 [Pleopsidium flavum]
MNIMAAMMDTQNDSIDISQLKKIALGFYDSDEDGHKQISGRPCLSSATDIAQSSLTAAAARPNANAFSTDHPSNDESSSRVDINALEHAYYHKGRSRARRALASSPVRSNSRSQEADSIASRKSVPQSDTCALVGSKATGSQLPSTIPESTERARTRKRKRKMEIYGSLSEGDTQPVSQWVYEEFTNKTRMQQTSNVSEQVQRLIDTSNGAAPYAYRQGISGHIDLLGEFEQQVVNYSEQEFDGEDGDGDASSDISQLDVDTEPTPEWKRFPQPKTPSTNGKKRNHMGEVMQSANTPGLPVNPFAENGLIGGGVMALSQVFKATQAPSSPFIHGLPSDALSERPSPDFYLNSQQPITDISSSPTKVLRRNEFQRALTEPQTTYVSMKESQAQRERLLGLYRSSSMNGLTVEEDSDEDFDSEESLLRRRRLQRRIDDQAKNQFAGLTAPQRPSSSGRDRDKGISGWRSHPSSQHKGRDSQDALIISDDAPGKDGLQNPSEDETEHELEADNDTHDLPTQKEDDKENIDVAGLQVPMTTSLAKTSAGHQGGSQQNPSMQRHGSFLDEEQRHYGGLGCKVDLEPRSNRSSGSTERIDMVMGGSQTVAIVDSQQSQPQQKTWETQTTAPPQTPAFPSSLCVPQSQNGLPFSCPPPDSAAVRRLVGPDSSPLPQPPPLYSSQEPSSSPMVERRRTTLDSSANNMELAANLHRETEVRPAAERSSPPSLRGNSPVESNQAGVSAKAENARKSKEEGLSLGEEEYRLPEVGATSTTNAQTLASTAHPGDARMLRSQAAGVTTLKSTIPETSPPGEYRPPLPAKHSFGRTFESFLGLVQANSTSKTEHQVPQSNNTSVFETAQTHLSSQEEAPAQNSRKQFHSAGPTVSPRVTRLRSFAEIASPTLPDAIDDEDIGITLITSRDIEYQAAINGSSPVRPSHKRRQGTGGRVLRVTDMEPNDSSPAIVSSTQEREKEGQRAALNGRLIAAPNGPAVPNKRSRLRRPFANPKGTSKTSEKVLATDPSSPPSAAGRRARSTTPISKPSPNQGEPASEPSDTVFKPTDVHRADTTRQAVDTGANVHATVETILNPNITNPNRVFAHFNGRNAAYYPATCISVQGTEEPRYKVRFDDGTVDTLGAYGVKRLELRKGDIIKVDLPNMRTKSYVVCGLQDKHELVVGLDAPFTIGRLAARQAAQPFTTDIRGYCTVEVYLKQRESLPTVGPLGDSEVISVPLNDIYLTQTMWSRFKDRQYTHAPDIPLQRPGFTTPSDRPSTPSIPSSKSRRTKTSALGQEATYQNQATSAHHGSGLFSDMVFAVTYGSKEEERHRVIEHIVDNGGRILQDGFHELFHIPHLQPVSPANPPEEREGTSLCLIKDGAQLGFACVIADGHSRRKKYLQALALGLPCLAGRWIEDCVAKDKLVNWEPYLLPSGDSSFLGGAVRSRILRPYPADTARLSVAIESRPKILSGHSVLLVMGRGKAEESRKAYLFLTYALGASKVSRALDLGAARKILAESDVTGDKWDFVHIDGKKSAGQVGTTKIVGNEFVIQSLISGQLLEDE